MNGYPSPILTVDIVPLVLDDSTLLVGLIKRPEDPFAGSLALPGGYVHVDEDENTRAAAQRVMASKTGLLDLFCEQLATFSGRRRDPRGWSASVAYYALIPGGMRPSLRTAELEWVSVDAVPELAFDHNHILQTALKRIRGKGRYSSLPAFFLGQTFTLAELRQVYELVLGTSLNDSAFRRKINELDTLEPVVGKKSKATARPAQLYRLKHEILLDFDRKI